MDKYITADPHIDHENIIRFCSRPFKNVNEMNAAIISNWNKKVKPDDTIYVLGDFAFAHKTQRIRDLNDQLNGHKILIYGNHDKTCKKVESMGFQAKTFYLEENIYDGVDYRTLVMFHYPMFSWNKQFHGSWHAYGHCHGTVVDKMNAMFPGTWDVGVDVNNFTPLSFTELAEKIKTTYPDGKITNGHDKRGYKRD